jgi:hypothetical protein
VATGVRDAERPTQNPTQIDGIAFIADFNARMKHLGKNTRITTIVMRDDPRVLYMRVDALGRFRDAITRQHKFDLFK